MIAEWMRTRAAAVSGEILSSYMRPAPKGLRILYLLGLSTGDFKATLTVLLGEGSGRMRYRR
jgi:hypothetical protein